MPKKLHAKEEKKVIEAFLRLVDDRQTDGRTDGWTDGRTTDNWALDFSAGGAKHWLVGPWILTSNHGVPKFH